jgi:WASH complex subunit strumpellin
MRTYTPHLHRRLKANPSMCLLLRATFQKMSSVLSLPLVRILQAGSKDDVSVAEYFSAELVAYVREVLQVIPKRYVMSRHFVLLCCFVVV